MKNLLAMALAFLMLHFSVFVYAAEPEQKEPAYMSISRYGKIVYILDREEIEAYQKWLDTYIAKHGVSEGEDDSFFGDFYQVNLHFQGEDENSSMSSFVPYGKNIEKVYRIFRKPVVTMMMEGNKTESVRLQEGEQQILLEKVEALYEPQQKYDIPLHLDPENPKRPGLILNRELYYFTDTFSDKDGRLYISLEDWNAAFSEQYGNTKQAFLQGENIAFFDRNTTIKPSVFEGKRYVPLREMIKVFPYFTLYWDANLKKAVVDEKIQDMPMQGAV